VARSVSGRVLVPHHHDPIRGAWVATATPASFEDPDGDPLLPGPPGADPTCRTAAVTAGVVQVECAKAYGPAPGLPPLAAFVGDHQVAAGVSDGWAATSPTVTISIQNGSPSLQSFQGPVESCFCRCARMDAEGLECLGSPTYAINTAAVPLPVQVSEADGDPLQVTFTGVTPYGGAQRTAYPGALGTTMTHPVLPVTVQITVDDGVVQAQATSTVTGVTCSRLGQACTL